MHSNSLTPMQISGTPRSFLNLDSRCPTSIDAIVIGGGLDNPLPTFWVGLVSMKMLSSLSVVAPLPSEVLSLPALLEVSRGIAFNPCRCAQWPDMRDWADGPGEQAGSRIP